MAEGQYNNVVAKLLRWIDGEDKPKPMTIEEFQAKNNLKVLSLAEYKVQFGQTDVKSRPAMLSWDEYVAKFGPAAPDLAKIKAAELEAIKPSLDRLTKDNPALREALASLPDLSALQAKVTRDGSIDLSRDKGDAVRQAQVWIREMARLDSGYAAKLRDAGIDVTASNWVDSDGGAKTAKAIQLAKTHYQAAIGGAGVDISTANVDAATLALMEAAARKQVTKGIADGVDTQIQTLMQRVNERAQALYTKALSAYQGQTTSLKPKYDEYVANYREQEKVWRAADTEADAKLRQDYDAYVIKANQHLRELYDKYRTDFVRNAESDEAREQNKPFAQQNPGLAKALPVIGGGLALGLTAIVTRRAVRRVNLGGADLASRLKDASDQFHEAIAAGNMAAAHRHGQVAMELADQFKSINRGIPTSLSAALGGCLVGDAAMVIPMLSDYARSLPGSELRDKTVKSLDPTNSELYGRILAGCAVGATGAKVGHSLAASRRGLNGRRLNAPDYTAEARAIDDLLRGNTTTLENLGAAHGALTAPRVPRIPERGAVLPTQ